MIDATPKHFFSNDFVLRSPDGTVIPLDVSVWRERAEFELERVSYRLYREGFMSGAFVLERAGLVVARALKPTALQARFDIEIQGQRFTLRKASFLSRRFVLLSGDAEIGAIEPAGAFTRRAFIELPSAWPLAHQIFVFWLVMIIWNRERSGSG
jgi:hypothetical protein